MMIGMMAALALQAAGPAAGSAASQPPPSARGEVVVRGARRPSEEVERFMRGFIELEGTNPLARFADEAICPGVTGLPEDQGQAIADRMRRLATAAGLEVDRDRKCRTNVFVILTPDRQGMLKWLRRNRGNMFDSGRREPVDVRDDGHASITWQLMGLVDAWGMPVASGNGNFSTISVPDGASRISAPTRPVVRFAAIIIDAAAIDGLTVTQLADYALMRTVAGAEPKRLNASSAPTIVKLLETPIGGEAPVTATTWDFSYLKALYAVPGNHYGQRQQTAIRRRMVKDQRSSH